MKIRERADEVVTTLGETTCREVDCTKPVDIVAKALTAVERDTLERAAAFFESEPDTEWEGDCIAKKLRALQSVQETSDDK